MPNPWPFFRRFGTVVDFYLNGERRFAFIEFEKPEEAQAALNGIKQEM